MAKLPITASMLYDFQICEHRVSLDLFGDPAERDPVDDFTKMLWEHGASFERETMEGKGIPFVNLKDVPRDKKESLTLDAMRSGAALIYGGRLSAGDLAGEPDLLRLSGGGYVAGDIKSGSGLEGERDGAQGRPKERYAVQLGLYTEILARKKLLGGSLPFIWDSKGREVEYDLSLRRRKTDTRTFQDVYEGSLGAVRDIVSRRRRTLPAVGSHCHGCCWATSCLRWAEEADDLTLLPGCARKHRDSLREHFATVQGFAEADLSAFVRGRARIPGFGPERLATWQRRAQLQKAADPKPYFTERVKFPPDTLELFYDVETDPLCDDLCYLHGFLERRGSDIRTERYVPFFADGATAEAEREIFAKAWKYIRSSGATAVYHYAPYEKNILRGLVKKYPDVAAPEEVERFIAGFTDLCNDVVVKRMIWPTYNHSIKTVAPFVGFRWRDAHPSGAASIGWFEEWTRTGDVSWKDRILEYNEDDCRAMRCVLDAVKTMPVRD